MAKTKPLTATQPSKPTQPKPVPPKPAPPIAKPIPQPVGNSGTREMVTITSKDVGTIPAGLIKSNQPSNTALSKVKIPAFLQSVPTPELSDRQQTGYVGFASSQSKKWPLQQQAGLKEGQPFLFHNQSFVPLNALEFFLCAGESFQTVMVGKEGKFHYGTKDMKEQRPQEVVNGNVAKLEPHYVCLLLVVVGDTLLSIKGDFRGTKSGGIENAIRAVEAASNPDWLRLSEQHKVTAAFPEPWGRVFHWIGTKRGVSKTNGNPYFAAECTSAPATIDQMGMLVENLKNDDFNNILTEAYNNYNARIEFLNTVVTGENKSE